MLLTELAVLCSAAGKHEPQSFYPSVQEGAVVPQGLPMPPAATWALEEQL